MKSNLILVAVVLLLKSPYGSTQTMCHPHCECDSGDVVCSNLRDIPTTIPTKTTFLMLSDNFIGPILLKNQIDNLFYLPLRELYLKNNRISAIEDFAFSALSELQVLDISNNQIIELRDDTFAGLGNLTFLFANDAGIVSIASQAFSHVPKVIEIDLENNMLQSIGIEFTTLTEVSELLLAQNKISSIVKGAFSSLNKLTHLSLFGNNLNYPMSSWFREVIENNGTVELDFRIRSTLSLPNPWLCCPEIALYKNYLLTLDRSLVSYPQLNLVCSWPVFLSGRLLSTVSAEELNEVPCADYTTTTVSTTTLAERDITPSTKNPNQVIIKQSKRNFLSSLNDAGLFFLILFFIVLGCSIGLLAFWLKEKNGGKKIRQFMSTKRSKSTEKNVEEGPRPSKTSLSKNDGRQQSTRPKKPLRPAPTVPLAPPRPHRPHGAIQPNRNQHTTTDTDYSEEDIWSQNT